MLVRSGTRTPDDAFVVDYCSIYIDGSKVGDRVASTIVIHICLIWRSIDMTIFCSVFMSGWSYNVLYVHRRTTNDNDDDDDDDDDKGSFIDQSRSNVVRLRSQWK